MMTMKRWGGELEEEEIDGVIEVEPVPATRGPSGAVIWYR
jgi:hypothetical protein